MSLAWVTLAPLSIASLVAVVSWPFRLPTMRRRIVRFLCCCPVERGLTLHYSHSLLLLRQTIVGWAKLRSTRSASPAARRSTVPTRRELAPDTKRVGTVLLCATCKAVHVDRTFAHPPIYSLRHSI